MDNLVKIKQRAFQIQRVRFLCWFSENMLFAVLFPFFLVILILFFPLSPSFFFIVCTLCYVSKRNCPPHIKQK